MSRITAGMATALSTGVIHLDYLIKLDYSSGADFLWTGARDLVWDGDTYQAGHTFEGFSGIEETTELDAKGIQLNISGIPSASLSIALTENYRNRDAKIYLACMDTTDWSVIADPVCIFSGKIDTQSIIEQGDTATISIAVESKLVDFERPRRRMWTHEDQQLVSTLDLGLQYVAELGNQQITWGR